MSNEMFTTLVAKSPSTRQILRYFGLGPTGANRNTLKKRITSLGLDISHFTAPRGAVPKVAVSLCEVMVVGSKYARGHLKARLLKEGFLINTCAICGLGEMWNGKSITMRLDHENGVRDDNRLKNLRMVCPNCDSQLDTFSNKNWRRTTRQILRLCSGCGKEIHKDGKHGMCMSCYSFSNTKIIWPSLDELNALVAANPMVKVGKMLGVSDNAVRKRLKRLTDRLESVAVPTMGMLGKSVELVL
jgi:protein-arginine kinase activator protein McsA